MLGSKQLIVLFVFGSLLVPSINARAQILKDEVPENAQGIDVENKVGDFIPLDAIFEDELGNRIGLGRFFKKGKPIVLTLNYSDCPGLCIAQLDNLVGTLRAMNSKGLGSDFEIVTISIDPQEDNIKAAKTKAKYTGLLRNTKADDAWHFLTGRQSEIKKVANAVGFRYSYDRVNKRYNHPAATYFVSENGRICRYLLSLGVEPQQFQLAVAEANEGKLTLSVADAIIQFCYLYDPNANRYSASARRILAFGAAAFCLLLSATTAPFWFRGKANAETNSVAEAEELQLNDETSQPSVGEVVPDDPCEASVASSSHSHSFNGSEE